MIYTRDYYEEGVAKGISGYTNYTWLPEFTIPLAHRLTKKLHLSERTKVLDYGCAKGFLVKALRLLDVPAFGCDVSEYAISQVDPNYARFCTVGGVPSDHYDWIIAKDVLEHLDTDALSSFIQEAYAKADALFVVVPLGKDGKYVIPQYENDVTHVIREPLSWWYDVLAARWEYIQYSTDMTGLKDSWAHYKDGNAYFICGKD